MRPNASLAPGCRPECPGCHHRHLSEAASLRQKQHWLSQRLAPWAESLNPIQSPRSERRWGYRAKVSLSCHWSETRGWQFGLWHRDSLIDIRHCPVHHPSVNATLALLAEVLPPGPEFPLAFYCQSGRQVTLVLKCAHPPRSDWVEDQLTRPLRAQGIDALWWNLHPSAGRRLFAKRGWRQLWGTHESTDGQGLAYGPAAFQQLLPELAQAALSRAHGFLHPRAGDRVVDLYCGLGRTLKAWTEAGAQALGIELGAEAVDLARRNAPRATSLRGGCAQRLPQLREYTAPAIPGEELLYTNPPRTGMEPEITQWIAREYRPRRMAYLSCSAGTLARDLSQLCEAGYRVREITPFDFFPQTHHVETLTLLER